MSLDTRTEPLWPSRWPVIAKQECVDEVEAAVPEMRSEVIWLLPCDSCDRKTSCLVGKQKEVSELMFDREYLTRPRATTSSLFPFDRMRPCLREDLSLVPSYRKPLGSEDRYAVCSAWDLAWGEKAGGDWLVKMTGRVDRETGKKRLLDIVRMQKLSFLEQCQLIEEEWRKFRDDLVVVEDDVSQVVWKQYMSATTAVPVIGHSSSTKKDLQQGVPSLLLDIERGVWEFPYQPGSYKHDLVRLFLGEAEAFGWKDDRLEGVGEHDDTVMAWWHLNWGLNKLAARPEQVVPVSSGMQTRRRGRVL